MTTPFVPASSEGDTDLARRVALFLRQRHLALPSDLSITSSRGVTTLQGTTATYHQRQLLVAATQRVAGVVQVVDELNVLPVARKSSTRLPASALISATCLASALVALLLAGCGGGGPPRIETYPAQGTVTYQGQPLPGAFLALHPKSNLPPDVPTPTAVVRPNGSFALTTYDSEDGVPAGEYVVTFQWRKAVRAGNEFVPGPNLLPAKYSRAETSDVTIRIAAGQNDLAPIILRR